MKLPIFFILILILIFFSCRKDPVIPIIVQPKIIQPYLLDTSSKWTYFRQWGDGGMIENYYRDTIELFFDGDTLLSRKTIYDFNEESEIPTTRKYFKLKSFVRSYSESWPHDLHSSEIKISTYLRIDSINGVIYVAYLPGANYNWLGIEKEAVLYDFNMKDKDTLPYNVWNDGVTSIWTVRNSSSIILNGLKLRTFDVRNYQGMILGSYIEGIGAFEGFENRYYWGGRLIRFKNKDFEYLP